MIWRIEAKKACESGEIEGKARESSGQRGWEKGVGE
jgi:hypothetical protein